MKLSSFFLLSFFLLLACFSCTTNQVEEPYGNPPAESFDIDNSDSMAIYIADKVMEAMGGRKNWDETRFLKWNFFGSRKHVWDRYTGDVIIEGLRDSTFTRMNLNSMEGEVTIVDNELTKADSLDRYLERGKNRWINDSYWLIFPFKLKDSGVSLKYLNIDTTMSGQTAHILQLVFKDVGVTPQNKYVAYVDTSTYLVTQWDYYRNATDSVPRLRSPWTDYIEHCRLLLSSGRGDNRNITEISACDTLQQYFDQ